MINDKTYAALPARHHTASGTKTLKNPRRLIDRQEGAPCLALPVIPTDPFRFRAMLIVMVMMKL